MGKLFIRITDIRQSHSLLSQKPYGVIEARHGKLSFVQIRPFPKIISATEAAWIGNWSHRRVKRDRLQVYYNQPSRHKNFLVAKYAVSELGTTLATLRAGYRTLIEIARLKRSDAILCQVVGRRVTDRIMAYWGFEPHNPKARGRHYIRRFYGEYPKFTDWIEALETGDPAPVVTA